MVYHQQSVIIIYSRQFPKPNAPYEGIYTAHIARTLNQNHQTVIVICPIPYLPNFSWLKNKWRHYAVLSEINYTGTYQNMSVYYPRYLVIPVLTRLVAPLLQAIGVYRTIKKIRRQYTIKAINCHFIYPDGVAACLLGKWLKIPVLLTALGSDINVVSEKKYYRYMIIWALKNCHKASAVAKSLCQRMMALGIDKNKIVYTPNGVEVEQFSTLPSQHQARINVGLTPSINNQKYLIFVGRLHPVKGLDDLFEALSYLKAEALLDFHTLIIGDGEQLNHLKQLMLSLNLTDNISFMGAQPPEQIPQWLRASDALCLPSHFEGQPNVVMEALAAGIPVVACDVGDVNQLVNDRNGVLVKAKDPKELALAIEKIMNKKYCSSTITQTIAWADWKKSAQLYYQAMTQEY